MPPGYVFQMNALHMHLLLAGKHTVTNELIRYPQFTAASLAVDQTYYQNIHG
jgi:hypothetical protein